MKFILTIISLTILLFVVMFYIIPPDEVIFTKDGVKLEFKDE